MEELVRLIMYGGALVTLLLFIWGLMNRKWMMYPDHEAIVKIKDEIITELRKDNTDLKTALKEANGTARTAVHVAEKAV